MSETPMAALEAGLASEDAEERREAVCGLPPGLTVGALPLLIRALADQDWRVRKEAAARVATWPDIDGAVTSLIVVLADEDDVGQRNAAVDALVRIGGRAVQSLLAALAEGGEHRKFLIDTLGSIGDLAAVPGLLAALDDPDPNLRVAAAEALGAIGGTEAEGALEAQLGRADLLVRAAAVEALVRTGARVSIDAVRPCLEEVVLRAGGLRLLGRSSDVRALAPIAEALRGSGGRVLQSAVLAAADLLDSCPDRAAVVAALRELPEDARVQTRAILASPEMEDTEPRRAAAAVLGAARDLIAVPEIAASLADPRVSVACTDALAAMGEAAIEPLLGTANEAAADIRAEIYEVVGAFGDAAAVAESALIDALDDEAEVAAAAARVLGRVGRVGATAALSQAMDSDEPELAGAAATGLGKLAGRTGDESALRAVRGGLEHPFGEVRAASALALAELGDTGSARPIALQLTDRDPYARLAAIRALGSLGERGRAELRDRLAAEDDAEMADAIRAVLEPPGGTGEP